MNIRTQTCLIVRRGPEYLVGRILYSTEYRWSSSPWDAWSTRKREKAEDIARKTGGIMVLFNPISKETKVMGA